MLTPIARFAAVLAQVSVKPDPSAFPGGPQMQLIINGVAFVALLACLAGVLVGAGQMSLGKNTSNPRYETQGKTMVIACAAGAFLVGSAAAYINFFTNLGGKVS